MKKKLPENTYSERVNAAQSEDSFSLFAIPSTTAQSVYLYMQEAGYFHTSPPYFTERTNLNSFLLVYTLSGKGILSCEGREFTLTAGSCFLINCMEYHKYFTPPGCHWEFLWLHFNGSNALGYFREFTRNGFDILTGDIESTIEASLRRIFALHQKKDVTTEVKTSETITAILTELIVRRSATGAPSIMVPPYIREAESYIDRHFQSAISLDELAERLHISKYHLIREFARFVGVSPHEYQIEKRLSFAKELLKYTDTPVNEIALRCGINQTSHFINLFKDREHVTPLQFRKKWMP